MSLMCSFASAAPMAMAPNGRPNSAPREIASRVFREYKPASGKSTGRWRKAARASMSTSRSPNRALSAARSEANEGWRHLMRSWLGQAHGLLDLIGEGTRTLENIGSARRQRQHLTSGNRVLDLFDLRQQLVELANLYRRGELIDRRDTRVGVQQVRPES